MMYMYMCLPAADAGSWREGFWSSSISARVIVAATTSSSPSSSRYDLVPLVDLFVYIYIYIYMRIYICTSVYTYVYMCVNIYVQYILPRLRRWGTILCCWSTYVYTYKYMYIYIHMCICRYYFVLLATHIATLYNKQIATQTATHCNTL